MVCLLEAWREHSSEVRVSTLWGIVPADFGTGVSSGVQEIQQMPTAGPWLHTAPWQNSVMWSVFSQHGAEGNAELRINPESTPPVQHKTCEPLTGVQKGWQITCGTSCFMPCCFIAAGARSSDAGCTASRSQTFCSGFSLFCPADGRERDFWSSLFGYRDLKEEKLGVLCGFTHEPAEERRSPLYLPQRLSSRE